jgi:phosphohistidine swiveling domain-containing protein
LDMNAKDLIKILPKDYRKHASRDLTIFTSTIFGESYARSFKELFGIEFSSTLWIVRNGNYTTFYRSESDQQNFRKQIGEKLRDEKYAYHCIAKLIELTDWFNEFIQKNNSLELFMQKRVEFVNMYRDFFAYHQAVYWGADYLIDYHPELTNTIKSLQNVYAYNERVVPDVERYLSELNIGHLNHMQTEGEFKEVGLLFFNGQENVSLYDEDLEELESFIKGLSNIETDLKELKGISVSSGIITGMVQIVKDPNKLHEINIENILVTGMTRPQFNHILCKCKGIIANEGNILSHAAILAREFQIPCVVGTKFATEILRDGDIVELDATNGIVRLLQRK